MSDELSRRRFLAGMSAAGLSAAALGIAGCKAKDPEPSGDPEPSPDPAPAPAPEPDNGVPKSGTRYTKWANPAGISYVHPSTKSETYDVVVVGSGITGFCSAMVIAENAPDAKILMIEGQPILGGNTLWAEICGNSGENTLEQAKEKAWAKVTDSKMLRNFYLWTDFYYEAGMDSEWYFHKHNVKQDETYRYYVGWTGASAIKTLSEEVATNPAMKNIEIRTNCRGIALLVSDDGYTVNGIQVLENGEYININAKAVMLGTGGMTSNLELNEYYVNEELRGKCCGYGGPGQDGDGHLMVEATAHGKAKMAYPNGGHQLFRDVRFDARLRYAMSEMDWNVFVNEFGDRYDDESRTKATTPGYAIMTQGKCWSIMSDTLVKAFEASGSHRANSFYYRTPTSLQGDLEKYKDNKYVVTANTWKELGEKMGLYDVDNFVKTMETYNADCEAGTGDSVFGKKPEGMIKLEPPYSAWPIYGGNCSTCGGIRVDVNCQVCDPYFKPIKGLYAGGIAISGFNTMVYSAGTAQGVGLWAGLKGGRSIVERELGGKVPANWYGEHQYDGPFDNMAASNGVKPELEQFDALKLYFD